MAGYRYGPGAISTPIPQFTPTTSGVSTGTGVSVFLALYASIPFYFPT